MDLSEQSKHERIYLQRDTDGEVTWCQDKINDDDCEYVRADIVKRLRLELDDYNAYYKKVINDECAPDEVHCTCVPALRAEIKRLREWQRCAFKAYPNIDLSIERLKYKLTPSSKGARDDEGS